MLFQVLFRFVFLATFIFFSSRLFLFNLKIRFHGTCKNTAVHCFCHIKNYIRRVHCFSISRCIHTLYHTYIIIRKTVALIYLSYHQCGAKRFEFDTERIRYIYVNKYRTYTSTCTVHLLDTRTIFCAHICCTIE